MNFNLQDYEPDVQNYMIEESKKANLPMYKDEVYINWEGKVFLILEDSPAGNSYVKCTCKDKFGTYIGYRPKIVLTS